MRDLLAPMVDRPLERGHLGNIPTIVQVIHAEQGCDVPVVYVEHGRRNVGFVFHAPGVQALQRGQRLGRA